MNRLPWARLPLGAWRLLRTLGQIAAGLVTVTVVLPRLDEAGRQRRVQAWAAATLRALGLRLEVEGSAAPGGALLVANHVSWLDILAVHAVCPRARFVSKADVRAWPLLNRLVDAAGTLYLTRENRRDALRVVHGIAEALRAGDTVAVFPEGTTSDGHGLLPFHANLLQAPVAAAAPVQPLALRYRDAAGEPSLAPAYIGQMTLLRSVWQVALARGLVVRLRWLPPHRPPHGERRALAEALHADIAAALGRLPG